MMMKKYLILLMTAVAVFASCGQENLLSEDETVQQTPITFNLTANHPDATKAVKTGWEEGDAIFVFFNNVAAPKHLKMTYNGSAWTSKEYNGATQTDGTLGLKDGDSGTMRAVYLPFGSNATVSADGTSFVFSTTYYAYYLTATLEYTVTNGTVSGAFNMSIPDGYVQFFIEDESATDGVYTLGTDAVVPVGVASIAADGTITETSDMTYVDDMPGYAYSGGYLFSGKLNDSYSYGGYYFAKTNSSDNTRADYFVSGKTLSSHSAVKLPANDNMYSPSNTSGKWVPVGRDKTVDMGNVDVDAYMTMDLRKWHTCNVDATKPEEVGATFTYSEAMTLDDVNIATKGTFDTMLAHLSWTWLSVNGKQGVVVKAKTTNGFLFLPEMTDGAACSVYWTSTADGDNNAYILAYAFKVNFYSTYSGVNYSTFPVRALGN